MPPFAVPAVPPRQRILYLPRFGNAPVDPAIAASTAAAAARLAGLGHRVEEAAAPFTTDELAALFGPVGQAGLAWLMAEKSAEPTAPMLREMAPAGRWAPRRCSARWTASPASAAAWRASSPPGT
jgi:aspartyl-tRNA(Asn)/glutamyl-tRNA(Gln) amidotransferase subunit A